MKIIRLKNEWEVGELIGSGGFGRVYRAVSGDRECALKIVPKLPGADRELLFSDLCGLGAVNIVPILESGEINEQWVLVMPLAECSLRDKLIYKGSFQLDKALLLLSDICEAIDSISNKIVHRDIKPENILLLDKRWCLADFGIARYVETSTDKNTRKFAFTPQYAAPERWRFERATTATDVYSVGIVAYEILTGNLPFKGPSREDFREQHLHSKAPMIEDIPDSVSAIIDECLYKSPGARPSPSEILARINQAVSSTRSMGRSKLVEANREEIRKRVEEDRKKSLQESEAMRRAELYKSAEESLKKVSQEMIDIISADASSAKIEKTVGSGWLISIGNARMMLSGITASSSNPWGCWDAPAFDVIAYADIKLTIPKDRYGWEGRSHSLWFCDAVEAGSYAWFETAFMITPLIRSESALSPFSLPPSEEAAKALWMGLAEFQVAWPFEVVGQGNIEQFTDRWADWLADATMGKLSHPRSMPERTPEDSWRKK